MRDHRHELGDVLPVLVTFAQDVHRLSDYRDHLGIDFPVLADADRRLYAAVGAGRGDLRRGWSPGTIATYARLVLRGRRLRRPNEDTRQLGADLLIDAEGRLARLWLPSGPDRRPDIDDLLAAARAISSDS